MFSIIPFFNCLLLCLVAWIFCLQLSSSILSDGTLLCEKHEFRCNNTGLCIPLNWVCDGENDCGDKDASDEHPEQGCVKSPNPCIAAGCTTLCLLQPGGNATCACPDNYVLEDDHVSCRNNCTSSQFVCHATSKCIPSWWYCDTQDDCGDKSDEPEDCPPFHCSPGQFQCNNGNCIQPNQICDGVSQCQDKSDEQDCDKHTCLLSQFKCPRNGTTEAYCISSANHCDGTKDCLGGEDEMDCTNRVCPRNSFRCNSGRCIPLSWKCDGDNDCSDKEDEAVSCDNTATCNLSSFKCNNNRCIPSRWRCDYADDCGDFSDEVDCMMRNCSESEFRCDNGKCISSSWHCNGEYNCDDHSDEYNCTVTCKPNEFLCKSTNFCILMDWRCDGDTDCADGSDEEGCGLTCQKGEFTCDNGICISALWQCDGETDCNDHSDEKPELCSKIVCPPGRFRCDNYICIPQFKVCDGWNDCGDNTDELSSSCPLYRHCQSHEFQCASGHCINNTFRCDHFEDCKDDSDEVDCEYGPCSFGACSQLCTAKKKNHFSCACVTGYHRVPGEKGSCRAEGKEAVIYLASGNKLKQINPYKPSAYDISDILNPEENLNRIDSIDILHKGSEVIVFWVNVHQKAIYRYKYSIVKDNQISNSLKREDNSPVIVIKNLSKPKSLAIDWVNNHIYWIDSGTYTISLSTLDGSLRQTVITANLDQPNNIAVDPEAGFIYWTDCGIDAKIERAQLDGSERIIIVNKNIIWPTGIAIDYPAKRLYWADPKASRVESVNTDGRHRHLIKAFNPTEEKPYKLDVFEDYIYMTTLPSNAVIRLNKFGKSNITYLVRGLNKANDIIIVHEKRQTKVNSTCTAEQNPCGEEALCISKKDSPHVCLCSETIDEVGDEKYFEHEPYIVSVPKLPEPLCRLNCYNGGTCFLDEENLMYCSCPPHWTGERCEVASTRCDGYCYNHGSCYYENKKRHCTCPDDFFGPRCEKCTPLVCQNGGVCKLDSSGDYICSCMIGYDGSLCELSRCTGYCQHGNCKIANGTPLCICEPGYSGKQCEQDLCDILCLNGGTCRRGPKIPSCICPQGFEGKRCQQDRCGCLNGATCVSTKTESGIDYACHCPVKYSGAHCETFNPSSCEDIECKNGGTCQVNNGIPICNCLPQWVGQWCEVHSDNWSKCIGYCLHKGVCKLLNGVGPPMCNCPRRRAGKRCEISTSCNNYCFNQATCVPSLNDDENPICLCLRGYAGNRCEFSTPCHSYCFNHATCVPSLKNSEKPTCLCQEGFVGLRCEISQPMTLPKSRENSSFPAEMVAAVGIPLCVVLLLILSCFWRGYLLQKKKGFAIHACENERFC